MDVVKEHMTTCGFALLVCTNVGCHEMMERRGVKRHREEECLFAEIPCKEKDSLGCGVKKMRKDMGEHEEDSLAHLPLAIKAIGELRREWQLRREWERIVEKMLEILEQHD